MADPSPTRPRPGRRIGDEQRHACADELADGFSAGRLTREEFETRLEQSLAAATDVDLALLTHDLRGAPTTRTAPVRPTRPVVSLTPVAIVKITAFELLLAVLSYVVAYQFGTADWPMIAVFLFAFGSVTGAAGAVLARPRERPVDRGDTGPRP